MVTDQKLMLGIKK